MPLTPVRPGDVIKRVLNGELPVTRREFDPAVGTTVERSVAVDRSHVAEMHQTYQREVKAARLNRIDGKAGRQHGMCYDSFRKLTYAAYKMGFITQVEEGEPVAPNSGFLLSTRGSWPPEGEGGTARVVQATRIVYALTGMGQDEETAWLNLTKAYKTFIIEGREGNGGPPVVTLLPDVPTIPLPENFTVRSVPRIIRHIEALITLVEGTDFPDPDNPFPALDAELERLQLQGESWVETAEASTAAAEDRGAGPAALEPLEERVQQLQQYVDALADLDLKGAQDALEEIS